MKVLILSGGAGTRLWPLSRTFFPKQFLKIKGKNRSCFQETFLRALKVADPAGIYIVTNRDYKYLVLGQLEELGHGIDESRLLLEPAGKNTLPAVLTGLRACAQGGNETVVVFPSDHLLEGEDQLIALIKENIVLARDYILTFGVVPSRAEIGYGYIKPGEKLGNSFKVQEFKEKPDRLSAEKYRQEGYLWNSGIFMFTKRLFLAEMRKHCAPVYRVFLENSDMAAFYAKTPPVSVDYGLLEKSDCVAVLPLKTRWSDLGSFDAFYEEYPRDGAGNVTFNEEILLNSRGNLLYCEGGKTVALLGVDDLIVIDQDDALLICRKNHSQLVKEVASLLKERKDPRLDYHSTAYRPWGSYTVLGEGPCYKIKRLSVLPGKKLSYQLHHKRSEHWLVVAGRAKVTIEGKEHVITCGESIFVKSGQKHRVGNPGETALDIIEVQLGEYLGEDDIVRFDDDFGRQFPLSDC